MLHIMQDVHYWLLLSYHRTMTDDSNGWGALLMWVSHALTLQPLKLHINYINFIKSILFKAGSPHNGVWWLVLSAAWFLCCDDHFCCAPWWSNILPCDLLSPCCLLCVRLPLSSSPSSGGLLVTSTFTMLRGGGRPQLEKEEYWRVNKHSLRALNKH